MKNGNKPAYPIDTLDPIHTPASAWHGFTKREVFAMAAMQGILASRELQKCLIHDAKHNGDTADNCIAAFAVRQADELLKELES